MENAKKAVMSVVVFVLLSFATQCFAGSLEPSGPPAPTMKTLNEIEPRIPIGTNTAPGDANCIYKITVSGSYYLTGNITGEPNKNGIVVEANDVSIDLCGFTLKGVANSLDGIRPSGHHTNLAVVNGIVSNWGVCGVTAYVYGFPSYDIIFYSRIENIIVADNATIGINAAKGSVVRGCIARDNGGDGFIMTDHGGVIENCVAVSNGGNGFMCYDGTTIRYCSSLDNTQAGIYTENNGHTIIGCTVTGNGGGGIEVSFNTVVKDCEVWANNNYGIRIGSNCLIEGNNIFQNTGDGISGRYIFGSAGRSRIQSNNICANTTYGINLTINTGNFIYANTLRNNTVGNLNVGPDNSAPSSGDPATAGAWHNIVF